MTKCFLLFFTYILIFSLPVYNQIHEAYEPLQNQGSLDEQVYQPASDLYEIKIEALEEQYGKHLDKDKTAYYLQTIFNVNQLFKSGSVLYHDEFDLYLRSIKDHLLAKETKLRESVEIYLLRSQAVNAFADGDSNIYVSLGLIAMLENESQLAFIISHEIGHIAKGHNLEFYLKAKNIDRSSKGNEVLTNSDFDDHMIVKNLYSQSLEKEADAYGIDLYLKSRYSTASINGVFDMLKYSYLPFENKPFDKSIFEDRYYKISSNLLLDSVSALTGEPEEKTAEEIVKSTHPSIAERRALVQSKIGVDLRSDTQTIVISDAAFQKLKQTALYELPSYYLSNFLYQDAIYTSYLLLQKTNSDIYLEKIIAKSLAYLSLFRNSSENKGYAEVADYEAYEGEQQQLYFMLAKMNNAELNTLAIIYIYKLYKKSPDDKELKDLLETLISELVSIHFKDESVFRKGDTIAEQTLIELADQENSGEQTGVKPEIYKLIHKSYKGSSHLLYAFNSFWNDPEFAMMFSQVYSSIKSTDQETKNLYLLNLEAVHRQVYGTRLGIKKVVVVDPFYLRYDTRKGKGIQYITSEEGESEYFDILNKNAKRLDLDIEILDPLLMDKDKTAAFNDLTILNNWFYEQLYYGTMNVPGQHQEWVDEIAKKYGTEYFLWSGIITFREQNRILGPLGLMMLTRFFYPLFPVGLYQLFSPNYQFFYVSVIYNITTHEAEVLKYLLVKKSDTKAILNSHTYDVLYQITTEPKNY